METYVRNNAKVVGELMSSHVGQQLLKILDNTFCVGNMVGENPHLTYFNLGQRDVVEYLKQLGRISDQQLSEINPDAT